MSPRFLTFFGALLGIVISYWYQHDTRVNNQSTANNREMQDAVASLTRQLNAAETAKAEAEAHSASLDVKVAEAEQAEEKIRAAQRSMAALCVRFEHMNSVDRVKLPVPVSIFCAMSIFCLPPI